MRCHSLRGTWGSVALAVLTGVALAVWAPAVSAQSTYGAVVGVLTDTTKAVVPGAPVTLTEVQTNVKRSMTSGPDGQGRAGQRGQRHESPGAAKGRAAHGRLLF